MHRAALRRSTQLLLLGALPASLLLGNAGTAFSQATSGETMLRRETMLAGGGRMGGSDSLRAISAIGHPAGGCVANGTVSVRVEAPLNPPSPPATRSITVEGAVDDPAAAVVVNETNAAVEGARFWADGIMLAEGTNTVTVTATDRAGNRTSRRVTVYFYSAPPARPTIASPQPFLTSPSSTLSGTKTPGTSIWLNGVEVVPLNLATTWSAAVPLVEGDNVLTFATKNADGIESASCTIIVILDQLPPVVTFTPPAKTNLTPALLTGRVDDSLTTVTINGAATRRTGRAFEIALPLSLGQNLLRLVAVSPAGYTTRTEEAVTLGTIPQLTAVEPRDTAWLVAEAETPFQASGVDQEGDPMEYQFALDDLLLRDWDASPGIAWTPRAAQCGRHRVRISVRDGYGGSRSTESRVWIIEPPVRHP